MRLHVVIPLACNYRELAAILTLCSSFDRGGGGVEPPTFRLVVKCASNKPSPLNTFISKQQEIHQFISVFLVSGLFRTENKQVAVEASEPDFEYEKRSKYKSI